MNVNSVQGTMRYSKIEMPRNRFYTGLALTVKMKSNIPMSRVYENEHPLDLVNYV